MYKAPLDWGAGYSPACVTLRSLHSHALHPQAVSTLLPRLISTRIIPAGIHSHLTWSECACKYTVALIQLNYKTSKQGSTSCDTDAIPFQARGPRGCHPGGTGQQEGIPPTHSLRLAQHSREGPAPWQSPPGLSFGSGISLHLASITHSQAQSERKCNTSWTNWQKNHLKLLNHLKDMRRVWPWGFLTNQNQVIPGSYKLHSSDCCLKRQHN